LHIYFDIFFKIFVKIHHVRFRAWSSTTVLSLNNTSKGDIKEGVFKLRLTSIPKRCETYCRTNNHRGTPNKSPCPRLEVCSGTLNKSLICPTLFKSRGQTQFKYSSSLFLWGVFYKQNHNKTPRSKIRPIDNDNNIIFY